MSKHRGRVNRDFNYTPAIETNLRQKFASLRKQQQQAAKAKAPRGWSSTDLTDEELAESYRLMGIDYEQGDPYGTRQTVGADSQGEG